MRCAFAFVAAVLVGSSTLAQKISKTAEKEDEFVFTKVEMLAGPVPGLWNAYLKKVTALAGRSAAGIPPGVYRVTVRFIIDREGNLADVNAKNNPGFGLAKKAEAVILNYDGIWQPANQCGRNVRSYKEELIQFVVAD